MDSSVEALQRHLDKLREDTELALLDGEHRLFTALANFLRESRHGLRHPRFQASLKALVWCLLFRGGVTVSVGIGILGMILAYQSNRLLHDQNRLIAEQNAYIGEQIAGMQQQLAVQQQDHVIGRRMELVSIVYGATPVQARAEAAKAIVEIDRARGMLPRLVGLRLAEASLPKEDLRCVNMRDADLRQTELAGANLSGANLVGASLMGANCFMTNFAKALLVAADLRRTNLAEADLSGASLLGADISYANLAEAHGIDQQSLDSTFGNAATVIPSGLARPQHWVSEAGERTKESEERDRQLYAAWYRTRLGPLRVLSSAVDSMYTELVEGARKAICPDLTESYLPLVSPTPRGAPRLLGPRPQGAP